MGRVKDHFWDEINERAAREADRYEPSPEDELEMMKIDAEFAKARYEAAKTKREQNERAR